jgi:hypothetical protein
VTGRSNGEGFRLPTEAIGETRLAEPIEAKLEKIEPLARQVDGLEVIVTMLAWTVAALFVAVVVLGVVMVVVL